MKITLVRTMTIALLATSISAFAQSGNPKPENSSPTCSSTQENDSNLQAKATQSNLSPRVDRLLNEVNQLERETQKTGQEEQEKIRRQDREWERALQGVYGG